MKNKEVEEIVKKTDEWVNYIFEDSLIDKERKTILNFVIWTWTIHHSDYFVAISFNENTKIYDGIVSVRAVNESNKGYIFDRFYNLSFDEMTTKVTTYLEENKNLVKPFSSDSDTKIRHINFMKKRKPSIAEKIMSMIIKDKECM